MALKTDDLQCDHRAKAVWFWVGLACIFCNIEA